MPISREQTRTAKAAAKTELAHVPGIVGIGVTKVGADYALKVNLSAKLPAGVRMPKAIAGVPLSVEVVGTIRKR